MPPRSPSPFSLRRLPPYSGALRIVGLTLCVLACMAAVWRSGVSELTHDGLVVRALGATLGVAGMMVAYAAIRAAEGLRRVAALALSIPLIGLAGTLVVVPRVAALPYDQGWAMLVPWLVGLPGIMALMLSRQSRGM